MRISNENSLTEKYFSMSVSDVSKETRISYNEYHFRILNPEYICICIIMHKTVCEGEIVRFIFLYLFFRICVFEIGYKISKTRKQKSLKLLLLYLKIIIVIESYCF